MSSETLETLEIPDTLGNPRRQVLAIGLAVGLTLPGLALRLTGTHPAEWVAAILFGVVVVGAAFLLAWGAEILELDVSQDLSIALLAMRGLLKPGLRTPVAELANPRDDTQPVGALA